jgi:fructose-specific phosphotransferase system IIC component
MGTAIHCSNAMRRNEPNVAPASGQTVVATGVLFAVVVAVLLAASHPEAVVAASVGGSAVTVTAVGAVVVRRRVGRARLFRVPGTDVCVEA